MTTKVTKLETEREQIQRAIDHPAKRGKIDKLVCDLYGLTQWTEVQDSTNF